MKDGSWHPLAQSPAVWKVQSETPIRKAQVRFYCQPCANEVQNWPDGTFWSLKEQLDYIGSERMDPRLEKKLADPNSMFARNPAFKRGAADVQKLYSDSFNDLVEKVRNVVGKDDLTPNELASVIMNTMMRNVQAIQQIEQSNSDELVELAIEGTLNEMEISDDTFIIRATLGTGLS